MKMADVSVRSFQSDSHRGQMIIRGRIRSDPLEIIRTRTIGANGAKRIETVSVSNNVAHRSVELWKVDRGWAIQRVVTQCKDLYSDELYVGDKGGSVRRNRYGGLVAYVQGYTMCDLERAYRTRNRNASADGTPLQAADH